MGFVAGAFVASPELRAYAADTVFSSDITDGEVKTADLGSNSVTAPKIKDGEVKAAEIATDAVGAAEIQGVTKLLFGECSTSEHHGRSLSTQSWVTVICNVSGTDTDDNVIATFDYNGVCWGVDQAFVKSSGVVGVNIKNDCISTQTFPSASKVALVVYDK